ncbi:MAG: serine/threonine protein kinase [Bryobacterales bacterium]|nr:serine/threonine protein kinase [Bryobacterales bacterium]
MERWKRVQQIFEAVADLPETARAARLSELCVDDAGLRDEVESLLSFDAKTAPFQRAVSETAASLDGPEFIHAGPYRILREIGRGGMGAVYLAVRDDDEFQREVAVKVVKRGMDTDAIVQRFRTERQILALLEHPRIARLYDGGSTPDGRPYLVMEYVPGEPIVAYCRDRNLPLQERLQLFRQVCEGVEQAHRRLVVHRDLKPSNILVADGQVKLLDFGIAKLLDSDAQHTMAMTGMRMLTPEYASPEQVRGEPVTTATDIYALGVVLYELLTGKPAHALETGTLEELERVVCGGVQPVTGISEELDHIIRMATRLEPERRYTAVGHLSDDIARYLEQRPILARPDTLGYRASKFVRRHRGAVTAATLLLLTLIGGIAATLWQAHRANENARRAEERFKQVRRLANVFLFELEPKVRRLAGSTDARELMARTATEYLDSLAKEAAGDVGLQMELATGYQRIADVQGSDGEANLGRPIEAQQNYQKAIALLESAVRESPRPEALLALGRLEERIAKLVTRTGEFRRTIDHREKALLWARRYRAAKPQDNAGLLLEIEALADLASEYRSRGEYPKSLDYLRRAEPLARQLTERAPGPDSEETAALLAFNRGRVHTLSGQIAQAAELHRVAVAKREGVWRQSPRDVPAGLRLMIAYRTLAIALGDPEWTNLGKYAEAAELHRKTIAIGDELAKQDTRDQAAARSTSVSLFGLAKILTLQGQPAAALPHLDRAIRIKEPAAREAANINGKIDLAVFLVERSVAHRRLGLFQKEIADLREAIEWHRRVQTLSPKREDLILNRVHPLTLLGQALARNASRGAADAAFSEALSVTHHLDPAKASTEQVRDRAALLYAAALFYTGEKGCDLYRQAGPYLDEANRRAVIHSYWRRMTPEPGPNCP